MKTFFLKLLLFILPIGLMYVFPAAVVVLGREYVSTDEVVRVQHADQSALFSFAYNPQTFVAYKTKMVAETHPQVIALGTSRVMQFRKEFFAAPTSFVNAGGAGTTLLQMKQFVEALPTSSTSTVIIVGLDHELFLKPLVPSVDEEDGVTAGIKTVVTANRRMYLDYFAKKFSMGTLWQAWRSSPHIGLSALIHGDGFRADGSYRYHQFELEHGIGDRVSREVAGRVESLAQTQKDTPGTEKIVAAHLRELADVVKLCKEKHITLVGFVPPYPAPIYDAMQQSTRTNQMLVNDVPRSMRNIFSNNEMMFFNFATTDTFGGTDGEYVDAVHGSDRMYARITRYIALHDEAFARVATSTAVLGRMIAHSNGIFLRL